MKSAIKAITLLTLITAQTISAEIDTGKLQEALVSAIKEEAVNTVPLIIDAGAKPTKELVELSQEQTLPFAQSVYSGKNPDNFEHLQNNMRIIKAFSKKGVSKENEKLNNYLGWIIARSKDKESGFRDRDIKQFNDEFGAIIQEMKPTK